MCHLMKYISTFLILRRWYTRVILGRELIKVEQSLCWVPDNNNLHLLFTVESQSWQNGSNTKKTTKRFWTTNTRRKRHPIERRTKWPQCAINERQWCMYASPNGYTQDGRTNAVMYAVVVWIWLEWCLEFVGVREAAEPTNGPVVSGNHAFVIW